MIMRKGFILSVSCGLLMLPNLVMASESAQPSPTAVTMSAPAGQKLSAKVTGVVTDAEGEALPGATVLIEGTT